MKKTNIFTLIGCSLLIFFSSCSDILEEQPRSILTPDFFKSVQGIEAGLTASYSALRYQYGPEGAMTISCVGTDECTYGGDGSAVDVNDYGSGLFNNGHFSTPWNRNFTYINTCNGIVEYGPAANREDLVAEAKFLRAQYYFNLVSTFGGVPLDLGAGNLKFNDTPTTTSSRNSAIEVYEAILADFLDAYKNLPYLPKATGRVAKSAALHFIAKTYLAMACYYQYDYTHELKGATDAGKAQEYYKLSLQYANELINNRSTYNAALLKDFGDVNKDGNEHNPEVLFLVEHTGASYLFDESAAGTGGVDGGLKENRACFMMCPYYEEHGQLLNGSKLMIRSIEYGRGWRRFIPTNWLLNVAFADKQNDSRYYKSFQSVWKCNSENTVGLKKDNGALSALGDTAIYMPGYTMSTAQKQAFVARTGARVWEPEVYTRNMFPANLKLAAPGRNALNDASNRPFLVSKLSETMLIAAEAALMSGGDPTPYINELRVRAAYNAVNPYADAVKAMTVSKNVIDLDFILNERSRELCAEQHRFFDLARTNKLVEKIQKGYNVFLIGNTDNAAKNIQAYHSLRPIPQSQIDAMTNENKASYQNPGYN